MADNVVTVLKCYYPTQSLKEIKDPLFWRDVLIETVCCMFIEACVIWALTTLHPAMYMPSTTHFGLFAGFFIYELIEGYGPHTGCPINPAGCWGFFLAGRLSAARTFFYSIGEIGGSAAGAMIAASLTPSYHVFNPLVPGKGMTDGQGMMVEAILTFNLLFVALTVTSKPNHSSLPVAFCIGTGIMAAGTHTGGLQNPIVPLGPAVVSRNFEHHWLYWIGPYLGATVGALFYMMCVFMKEYMEKKQKAKEQAEDYGGRPIEMKHSYSIQSDIAFVNNYDKPISRENTEVSLQA